MFRAAAGALRRALGLGRGGAEGAAASAGMDTSGFDVNIANVRSQLLALRPPVAPNNTAVQAALAQTVEDLAKVHTGAELRVLGAHSFAGEGGVPRDVGKAVHLWVAAGLKGDGEALYSLAQCCLNGVGIEPDPARAAIIFDELIKAGHPWAHFARGAMLAAGHAADPSGPECTRALELMKIAAQKGVAPAFLNVANMLEGGIGAARDANASTEWFVSAARRGDPRAQVIVAQRLAVGSHGLAKDEKAAFAVLTAAAGGGYPKALYNVAMAYLEGGAYGVEKDPARGVSYLVQAAEAGFLYAQLNLGLLYESGTHVPQSVASAESWYTRAAAQGDGRLGQERLASLRQAAAAGTETGVTAGDGRPATVVELAGAGASVPTMDVRVEVASAAEAAALAHELSSRGVGANAKDVLEFLRSRSGARVQGVQVSKPTAAAAAAPTAGDGSQSRADTRAAAAPSEDRR